MSLVVVTTSATPPPPALESAGFSYLATSYDSTVLLSLLCVPPSASLTCNSISISLIRELVYISANIRYWEFFTNSLISLLNILKYQVIRSLSVDVYSGQHVTLSWNIRVISITVSVVFRNDRYSWSNHSLSTKGTYSFSNTSTNRSHLTASFSKGDKSAVTNFH